MDTLVYQCLECDAADAIGYAESADGGLLYCVCLSCGELMLVGDFELDTPLHPANDNSVIFYEEETNTLRAERDALREACEAAKTTLIELIERGVVPESALKVVVLTIAEINSAALNASDDDGGAGEDGEYE